MIDLSTHEKQRLAALAQYGLMDTPREAEFDEIAELVAAICDTPIAVVEHVILWAGDPGE
jgi:hypothetical protein